MAKQDIRSVLCHGLQPAKIWFYENVWPDIPAAKIEEAIDLLEQINSKWSVQMYLFEIWRYATLYLNVYGETGLKDFLDFMFGTCYQ